MIVAAASTGAFCGRRRSRAAGAGKGLGAAISALNTYVLGRSRRPLSIMKAPPEATPAG